MRSKIKIFFTNPPLVYLALSIVTGIGLAFILPPFRGPDEASHVFRIYELTKSDVLLNKQGDDYGFAIPDSLQRVNLTGFAANDASWLARQTKYIDAGAHRPDDKSSFQTFEGAGVYPPFAYINYLPFSVIGRSLHLNEYHYFMLLRICGLLISALIIYAAIRITTIGKWLFVAIGLMPMTLHQMSVVSTDGLVISCSLLFVATTMHLIATFKTPTEWPKKWLLILMLSGIIIASKPGYWPILFILVLSLKNYRQILAPSHRRIIGLMIVPLLIFCSWYVVLLAYNQNRMQHFFEHANPHSKLMPIKRVIKDTLNPLAVADRFGQTYVYQPYFKRLGFDFTWHYQPTFVFNTFIGSFGSLNAYPPSWMSLTVISSLVIGLIISPTGTSLRRWQRGIGITLWAIGFVLISYIFWITWTAEDMPFIFGVQGRYFLPLLALSIFLIPQKRALNFSARTQLITLLVLIGINLTTTVVTIANYFYNVT